MTQPISNEANIGGDCDHGYPAGRHCPICEKPKSTVSNEAVEAAKEIADWIAGTDPWQQWEIDDMANRIQSAITKACAEKDTQHRLDLSEIRRQHQQEADEWKTDEDLSAQLAVMKEALTKIMCQYRHSVPVASEIASTALSNLPATARNQL